MTRGAMAFVLAWSLAQPSAMGQQGMLPLPPPAALPAGQAAATPATLQVPYQETMLLQWADANRVLSVNPSVVEATLRAPGHIELRGVAFGQTFLHIWSSSGRVTRMVQVVQPVPDRPTLEQQRRAAEQLAEHLTLEYQDRFVSLRRGPRLGDTDLNSTTQFYHHLAAQMETPHGNMRGTASFQRFNSIQELSSWSAVLSDGDIGPLERFSVAVGDTGVGFSDLTLPGGSIRGVQLSYYDVEPYEAQLFYGRRRFGVSSALSPGSDTTDDVFLSGVRLENRRRPWTWGVAYATASGEDRVDIQTSQALEASSWYWPDEHVGFGGEFGRTQDGAHGYRLKSALRGETLNVDAVYRNISQRYENLVGRSAEQGKRGLLLTSQFRPSRPLRFYQRLDLYEDGLFANPDEPDRLNVDAEWNADIDLTSSTLWSSRYSRQKLLGRLFATDTVTVGTSLRQRLGRLPLLGNGSVFADYQFRDVRSVSAPTSDFESQMIRVGLGAPLLEHLYWQVAQQWTALEDTFTGEESVPRETTAGISYAYQLKRIPLFLRGGVNVSTSADAGSPNSFLINEDRLSLDAGVRYECSRDLHLFLDSRLLRRAPESGAHEYQLELETGLRYLFDTGVSWEPSARLSGIVFHDLNADGQLETEETGLPRARVVAGAEREAVTDSAGRWYLGRIRGKRAEVAVDLSTIPEGLVPTSPTTIEVDLGSPPPMPILFGFIAQAELRVRVFVDATANGRYDATDAPLEGIRVTLQDGTTVKTDQAGWAFFRGISPGAYRVRLEVEDLAFGYVPMTPLVQERSVTEGRAAMVDVPVRAERSIGGRVFVDRNRNGRYDEEPTLSDVAVCLDDSRKVKTRADGQYLFKDVAAGLHRVSLNCRARVPGYIPLSATVQTIDVPARSIQFDAADFRLGEEAQILQDVTRDVLRERQIRRELVEEMLRARTRNASGGEVAEPTRQAP